MIHVFGLHNKDFKKLIGKLVLAAAFIGPLLTLPQIVKIFTTKTAEGVSFFTWFAFTILSVVWLIYGVIYKNKPIIIANTLWLIFDGLVSVGALIYD